MTQLIFDLQETSPLGDVPVYATISCYPVARRKDGGVLVTRKGFSVHHDMAPTIVTLHQTGPDSAWLITITSRNHDDVHGYYAVPAPTMVDGEEVPRLFNDLPMVDPDSLEPTAEPEPIWWAMARSTVTGGDVDSEGDLILTHYDGKTTNAGRVRGLPGADGKPGTDGRDGRPGPGGAPGVSVVLAEIDENGDLIVYLSNDQTANAGRAKGEPGLDGADDFDIATYINDGGSETSNALSSVIIRSAKLDGLIYRSIVPASVLRPTPHAPAGFRGLTRLPTPKIRRRMGRFEWWLNVEALRPPAGVTYYTAPGALPAGTGLSPADPGRVYNILANSDVGTIVFADGEYNRDVVTIVGPITKSINWLAAEGAKPKVTGFNRDDLITWTLTSGNIYQTTRSATQGIYDTKYLTEWGDFAVYTKKANLAAITGPGQWATVGSTVYVWATGNADLSAGDNKYQLRLQVSSISGVVAAGSSTHYVEGIEFWGCGSNTITYVGGVVATDNALVIARNCKVKYNFNYDGFVSTDGHLITIDCEASSNARDGFNYHDVLGNGGEFIDINGYAHHNGLVNPITNNGTTAHEAVTGIRINGVYEWAGGPTVADVNSAHTWNLGIYAGGSDSAISIAQKSAYRSDSVGFEHDPAQMWLDECTADEAHHAVRTTGEGNKIHVHALGWSTEAYSYVGSNIDNYERV